MKLLTMSKKVFNYYRENVAGNENTSYSQIQRKLTRNMKLAHKFDSTGYKGELYQYGNLKFLVVEDKVVWIKNRCKNIEGWKLDMNEYIRLSKELVIDDYDSKMDKLKKNVIVNTKRTINKIKWSVKDKLNESKVTV